MEKMNDGIIIRQAVKDDAPEIARLIVVPWPIEAFLSQKEGRTIDELIRLVQGIAETENTLYSYENTLIAADSSKPDIPVIGILTGYGGADLHKLRLPVEKTFNGNDGHRVQWEDETAAGEFYLDTLSVSQEYRKRGIGTALIEKMCKKAAALGHKKAGLLVDYDNPSAERLYLRLGFLTTNEMYFMGHRMKHMQKNL